MSNDAKTPEPNIEEIERVAARRAREKISSARWDNSAAVIAYGLLGALVLMRLDGVSMEIIAPVAIFGLALLWFVGWRRGKQQYSRFFYDELRGLSEVTEMKKAGPAKPSPLTSRETEILNCVASGCTNKEIAYKLKIGEQTIKNHMSSILDKLAASDRTHAVVTAMRYGWISFSDSELPDTGAGGATGKDLRS